MKVLCILDNLSIASGVSSIVLNLYRNMDLSRVQMDFLVCSKQEGSYEDEIERRGGKVFYTGNFLSPRQILGAISASKQFFKEHGNEYDLVHLHSPTIAMFTLRYAKQYGIPVRIVHSHSTMMSMSKVKTAINTYLIGQIKKYANVFFACSTEAAHFLYGKDFCDKHPIERIHNAVDCTRFLYDPEVAQSVRGALGVTDETVFAHVSNYSPIKNHVFLLDVMERFQSSAERVKFVFVGNGPTRQSFEDEILGRGLQEMCVFIDKTPDVAQYLFAADAVILPSIKEGLPVSLVEAQAAGLPFFTSDTVTQEVLVEQGQFLPLETNAWYDSLRAFAPLSVQKRKERSEAFQKSVFNIVNEAERVTALYEKLAKGESDPWKKKIRE